MTTTTLRVQAPLCLIVVLCFNTRGWLQILVRTPSYNNKQCCSRFPMVSDGVTSFNFASVARVGMPIGKYYPSICSKSRVASRRLAGPPRLSNTNRAAPTVRPKQGAPIMFGFASTEYLRIYINTRSLTHWRAPSLYFVLHQLESPLQAGHLDVPSSPGPGGCLTVLIAPMEGDTSTRNIDIVCCSCVLSSPISLTSERSADIVVVVVGGSKHRGCILRTSR